MITGKNRNYSLPILIIKFFPFRLLSLKLYKTWIPNFLHAFSLFPKRKQFQRNPENKSRLEIKDVIVDSDLYDSKFF